METGGIRRIPCEFPERKMWNLFLLLENDGMAKGYLRDKYQQEGLDHPDRASFRASHALMSYVRQARELYRAARESSPFVSPLLTYYGMMNLAKAWMLSFDPDYPRNALVLRHGASTRRRKRSDFRLSEDEIRIQPEGLLPELVRASGWGALCNTSWTIKHLLSLLPDIQDSYRQVFREASLYPIAIHTRSINGRQSMSFTLEEKVLDQLHLSPRGLAERLNSVAEEQGSRFTVDKSPAPCGWVRMWWSHPESTHVDRWKRGFAHPWFREDTRGGYYLYLNRGRTPDVIPEMFVHYLLLFSLSMLCRYEVPLWGEIVSGTAAKEAVLVEEFLQVTRRKFPNLILNTLFEEKILFVRS
ncbi:YaaC-like Protein [Marininema mesophilum]|uniref:YaaC-like Protein n=1 Tax=Marininema mesophilum TaxID=1048340 RepID=A0A1H3AF80_9BACL|nr:YaaC family protein [Marininema mesophilum]SDX27499.1 YaaC-like Protein [Marininema mesophilum]